MRWKKSGAMEQRTEFAVRAMQTLNFRALCQQYGISTKTGYKWRERFWRKGLVGMEEEVRRPKSHSKQLPEEEVCEIERLKLAHLAWGPRKIRELYLRRHGEVASESTFKRVLERTSLTQKRRRRRAPEAGRLSSGRQAAALNEVWTGIWIIQRCALGESAQGLNQPGRSTTLPQRESGRLVRRTQTNRRGFNGSLVWPPPAGPGGFRDEKFFSCGYPSEKNCK